MSSRVDPGPAFRRWNRAAPSMGVLALAAFGVAVATGVALAPGYDVARPLASLGALELASPVGRTLRAAHAWASHLTLILALLHVVEHLAAADGVRRLRAGPWLRVVLAVPALGLVAFTGFLLRGDAEGVLAHQLLAGLLERLPLAGGALATAIAGAGDDLQLVYVHHVGTLTFALGVVAIEHGRRLWPPAGAAIGVGLVALGLGWLLPPSLHDGLDPIAKGPWYALGLQELLHWLPRPGVPWALLAAPLALLAWLPRLAPAGYRRACLALTAVAVAFAALGLFAAAFRGAGWELAAPWHRPATLSPDPPATATLAAVDRIPEALGRPEGCLACHGQVTGLGPSHAPDALGCSGCHLGDPFAPEADRAHRGMVRVPGNLDTVARTCGRAGCHDAVAARVAGSPMATLRGVIAVDRWAFGEAATPDGLATVAGLGDSAADTHLRQLCVGCHLGSVKAEFGPAGEATRGGGCAACHVAYPERRTYGPDHAAAFAHPAIGLPDRDEPCAGCHGRSGRIALSYAGWRESRSSHDEPLPAGARALPDGRVLLRANPDVHHEKGLACVDCHTAAEAMGDGAIHLHEETATRVRCETCHRIAPARTAAFAALAPGEQTAVRRRWGEAAPARLLLEDASGEAITGAVARDDLTVELRGKHDGAAHVARPPSPRCRELPGHERLSCRACHETWVHRCESCHTQWDRAATRRDHLDGERHDGAWVEYGDAPEAGAPVLGVIERDGRPEIVPFAPGMILTVNGPDSPAPAPLPDEAAELIGPGTRFLRAHAPAVPHTTTRAGRSCADCHADPRSLGWGAGTIAWTAGGPRFTPARESLAFDGLPADAWIPPFGERGLSTRTNARPLDAAAQRRVLAVGECLACHDPEQDRALYARFAESLERRQPTCLEKRATASGDAPPAGADAPSATRPAASVPSPTPADR